MSIPSRPSLEVVASGDPGEHELKNRTIVTVNLTKFVRQSGGAEVRFEDSSPQDGWGAALFTAELRINGKIVAAFSAGSELETRFLGSERNSGFNGKNRFADRDGYWSYRFERLPADADITLTLDVGNSYKISAGRISSPGAIIKTTDPYFNRTLQNVRLSASYPLSDLAAPADSNAIFGTDPNNKVVWEKQIGQGWITYAGIPSAFFSANAQSSRLLRSIVSRSHIRSSGKYEESTQFVANRGPYVIVKTLGSDMDLEGRFVNLLSPTLAMVEDPNVPQRDQAIFMKTGTLNGAPKFLTASGRIRAKLSQSDTTGFFVQAPSGTEGIARIYRGNKNIIGAKAVDVFGVSVPVSYIVDGDTVLLKYKNDIQGLAIRVSWK